MKLKPIKNLEKVAGVRGRLVSVWRRESSRHQWHMIMSMVRVISFDGNDVVVQTGAESEGTGPTCFCLRGSGTWEKQLRKPVDL